MPMYTLWRFRSPSTGETVDVILASEPDELRYQHEYQRVLWRGFAASKTEAIAAAASEQAALPGAAKR